jgi:hypothetical protein
VLKACKSVRTSRWIFLLSKHVLIYTAYMSINESQRIIYVYKRVSLSEACGDAMRLDWRRQNNRPPAKSGHIAGGLEFVLERSFAASLIIQNTTNVLFLQTRAEVIAASWRQSCDSASCPPDTVLLPTNLIARRDLLLLLLYISKPSHLLHVRSGGWYRR